MRFSKLLTAAAAAAVMAPATLQAVHHEAMDKPDPVLVEVVDGDWRSAEDKARDQYRHPVESLTFWGLKPGMAILEIQPGSGSWWTQILAPYAARTGGQYFATAADLGNPETSDGARKARAAFEKSLSDEKLYGKVGLIDWGSKSIPLPPNKFDFILTARSIHGWMRTPGMVGKTFSEFYAALKPGGILAVEQHRADPGPQDEKAASGYVTEAYVIEQAEKAGFKLVARSEINANPRDTKDHPFGVWTLPPALRSTAYGSGQDADPNFDHSKYIAIGESDRMTLKFMKPQ
jgi:predicted methyltransferase